MSNESLDKFSDISPNIFIIKAICFFLSYKHFILIPLIPYLSSAYFQSTNFKKKLIVAKDNFYKKLDKWAQKMYMIRFERFIDFLFGLYNGSYTYSYKTVYKTVSKKKN